MLWMVIGEAVRKLWFLLTSSLVVVVIVAVDAWFIIIIDIAFWGSALGCLVGHWLVVFLPIFCETEWDCWLAASGIYRWQFHIAGHTKKGVGASKKTVFWLVSAAAVIKGNFEPNKFFQDERDVK